MPVSFTRWAFTLRNIRPIWICFYVLVNARRANAIQNFTGGEFNISRLVRFESDNRRNTCRNQREITDAHGRDQTYPLLQPTNAHIDQPSDSGRKAHQHARCGRCVLWRKILCAHDQQRLSAQRSEDNVRLTSSFVHHGLFILFSKNAMTLAFIF